MTLGTVKTLGVVGLAIASLTLAGCSDSAKESAKSAATSAASTAASAGAQATSKAGDMASTATSAGASATSKASMEMEHKMDGGPAPAGMRKAPNPKFPVGSKVTLAATHMPGMDGAKAKVVGAYKSHVYAVNYTPVSGGPEVKDHKWVVQEELANAGSKVYQAGEKVKLTADHMTGMKGADATVASETDETVYIVDYDMHGMTMKNHKWVVESEMKAQ